MADGRLTIVVTIDNEDVRQLIRAQHVASQIAAKYPGMVELAELNEHLAEIIVQAYAKRKVYR